MASKQSKKPTVPVVFQDRVLVTKVKPEEKTAGGIIIPETVIKDENKGIVVAVGPTVGKGIHTGLITAGSDQYPHVGDTILFGDYAGTKLEHDGKTYLIMRESDILAKI